MLTYEEYRHRAIIENNVDVLKACELADDHYDYALLEASEDLKTAVSWLILAKQHMSDEPLEDLEVFLAGLRAEGKVDGDE